MGQSGPHDIISEHEKLKAKEAEARELFIESSPVVQSILTSLNTRLADLANTIFALASNKDDFYNSAHNLALEGATIRKVITLIKTDKYS